jgi:photosystem II stability/assembly factor-like uncharacterized protein
VTAAGRCGRPGLVAAAATLWLVQAFFAAPVQGDESAAAAPAVASDKAATSLLLGAARAGARLVAVGERGHVVLSDDDGASWRQAASVPVQATLTSVAFADARLGWAVGHDAVILHTNDAGETWELQRADPELEAPLLSVRFADARCGLAVGAFGLALETCDAGASWQPLGISEGDPHLNHLFADATGRRFVAAESGTVFREERTGEAWTELSSPYAGSFWGGLALEEGSLLVFGMRGHVFRSDDLGDSWSRVESGTSQSLAGGVALDDGHVVLVGLGGAVLTSADAGASFRATVRPHRSGINAVLPAAAGRLLLFGEMGVEAIDVGE